MAAEIETITVDELDVTPLVTNDDILLVETVADGKMKSVTKSSLFRDESEIRENTDALLQEQINTIAGESGVYEKLNASLKGQPGGLAELDAGGHVPASQLPSYVDDIIEGYYNASDAKFYKHFAGAGTTYDSWTDGVNFYDSALDIMSQPTGTAGTAVALGNIRHVTSFNDVIYSASDGVYYNADLTDATMPEGATVLSTTSIGTVRRRNRKLYKTDGADWYQVTGFTSSDITAGDKVTSESVIAALNSLPDIIISYNQLSISCDIFAGKIDVNWQEVEGFTSSEIVYESSVISDARIISALEAESNISISYVPYSETEDSYYDEITPETGKVYTDLASNKTYRWGGSAYVVIASDLALGETASTAYRGDRGKTAYNHAQTRGTGVETATNPHALSKADIGLGDVPNVTTNNQTPTFTAAAENSELESGDTLSTLFGKLKKIVSSVIAHLASTSNPHSVTKAQVGLGNVENYGRDTRVLSGSDNYITSGAVYSELEGKQENITGAATSILSTDLAADKALVSDSDGKVAASSITSTELSYLCGATNNIQSQIDNIVHYCNTLPAAPKNHIYGTPENETVSMSLVRLAEKYFELDTTLNVYKPKRNVISTTLSVDGSSDMNITTISADFTSVNGAVTTTGASAVSGTVTLEKFYIGDTTNARYYNIGTADENGGGGGGGGLAPVTCIDSLTIQPETTSNLTFCLKCLPSTFNTESAYSMIGLSCDNQIKNLVGFSYDPATCYLCGNFCGKINIWPYVACWSGSGERCGCACIDVDAYGFYVSNYCCASDTLTNTSALLVCCDSIISCTSRACLAIDNNICVCSSYNANDYANICINGQNGVNGGICIRANTSPVCIYSGNNICFKTCRTSDNYYLSGESSFKRCSDSGINSELYQYANNIWYAIRNGTCNISVHAINCFDTGRENRLAVCCDANVGWQAYALMCDLSAAGGRSQITTPSTLAALFTALGDVNGTPTHINDPNVSFNVTDVNSSTITVCHLLGFITRPENTMAQFVGMVKATNGKKYHLDMWFNCTGGVECEWTLITPVPGTLYGSASASGINVEGAV